MGSAGLDVETLLRSHVAELSGRIGERNAWRKSRLDEARDYVRGTLCSLGLEVRSLAYRSDGLLFENIEASLPGRTDEVLLIGAHYDTVQGTPGSDDNASGVAVLLALARVFSLRAARETLPGTLRFVAFPNEEPPFFKTEGMGSLVYAREARRRGDRIGAAVILEMLGFYSDAKGSQGYPFPLGLFYPNRADFVGVVTNVTNSSLARRLHGALKTRFRSEMLAAPALIPGVDFSDHWSFWQAGYPAVMLTDTAFYRNAHYHGPGDTPETLDYPRMADLTRAMAEVLPKLSS